MIPSRHMKGLYSSLLRKIKLRVCEIPYTTAVPFLKHEHIRSRIYGLNLCSIHVARYALLVYL